jgi:hypothetical protein
MGTLELTPAVVSAVRQMTACQPNLALHHSTERRGFFKALAPLVPRSLHPSASTDCSHGRGRDVDQRRRRRDRRLAVAGRGRPAAGAAAAGGNAGRPLLRRGQGGAPVCFEFS